MWFELSVRISRQRGAPLTSVDFHFPKKPSPPETRVLVDVSSATLPSGFVIFMTDVIVYPFKESRKETIAFPFMRTVPSHVAASGACHDTVPPSGVGYSFPVKSKS